jgi:uncharacterized protein YaaN involved in tellurite resistance
MNPEKENKVEPISHFYTYTNDGELLHLHENKEKNRKNKSRTFILDLGGQDIELTLSELKKVDDLINRMIEAVEQTPPEIKETLSTTPASPPITFEEN